MSAASPFKIKFKPKNRAVQSSHITKTEVAVLPPSPSKLQVSWEITPDMIRDPDIAYKLIGDSRVSGLARLYLRDAKVVMPIRDAIFHLILWRIYHRFNIPIDSSMVHKRQAWHCGALANLQTKVMYDIKSKVPYTRKQLADALFDFMNYLYNFIVSELNPFVNTIDILGLARIINHPEIKEAIKVTYNPVLGTDVLEKTISEKNLILQEKVKDKSIIPPELNQLLVPLEVREMNLQQLCQMAIAYGPRSDCDDTIVTLPVLGNSLNGLKNILEFAIESLSAKKSAFYNQTAIKRSQYWNRRSCILGSSVRKLYPGDCGTANGINFLVTDVNWPNLIGMNARDEHGNLYALTEKVLISKVGSYVYLRNPITCPHTDGSCAVCFGALADNINETTNIGILATIQVIEPCTQRILSAKHFVKTNSVYYTLPAEAAKYFYRINANEIQWLPTKHKHLKHMSIGVSLKYLGNLQDIMVSNLDSEKTREERFSKLHEILIRNNKTGAVTTVPLLNGDVSPFFTLDMLRYIRQHVQNNGLSIGDTIFWIPLEGTDRFSIMKALIINDGTVQFVNAVSSFLSKGMSKYTSVTEALTDFSNLVYTKIDRAHISHMCIILKGYLVSGELDFRIPVVYDTENVRFRNASTILTSRSIGGLLAYQDLRRQLSSASIYLISRSESIFDALFNIDTDSEDYGSE